MAPLRVLDGYAPFCKLHVHRNWTSTRCLAVPITDGNRDLLRSAYEARTKEELDAIARARGYSPRWSHFVMQARQRRSA